MVTFALIAHSKILEFSSSPFPVHADFEWVDVTNILPVPEVGWAATQTGSDWTFKAPAGARLQTPAQQANAALSAGLTITSTATPAISGTYACDAPAQLKFATMYDLIQRAGGSAFPAGLTSLPWSDINGNVHMFTAVADFLNLESAIGNYVLALDLIITTNAGTIPSATATIA